MTKQSDIEMVAKARAWAVKAHAGQKDKAGKDYFKAHVTVVAEGVKGDPIAEAVAFLHDTVEDTSVAIEDIRTGFPKEVADAVSTLTHSKGISYAEYLWHIQQNSIAVKVKLSDLRSNIETRDLLIPQLKKIGVGWNGNFGISNSGLAYNSKLAYEILKTIRYATEKRDSSVLKVTNEPLPRAEGSFQIKAL